MTYPKNSLRIKISSIGVAKIFGGGGGQNANHMQRRNQKFSKGGNLTRQRYGRMEGQKPGPACGT